MEALQSPITLQAAKLASISASLLASGIFFSSSNLVIPLLSKLDHQRVTPGAFADFYHAGLRVVVPLTIVGSASSAVVAFLSKDKTERLVWSTAAVATFAVLPWTRLGMWQTINTLLKIADETGSGAGVVSEKEKKVVVQGLLTRWKTMNYARSAFTLVGGLIAGWKVVSGI
ncbi:hypothetical protein BGW36DRAFT_367976 [Talaromyces proteolyticus]|uniref:DUF1772-domain-containing protein n=1 Tax=Talaromyces proteolyticus TaxID=1131652 RepID=A0AAD4Q414_9EURO|nr:uncharacterized protein BGW36DRAFT_367976 [Talaromyces proteolyticus]KAH8705669.1 hypothetical protein BGW36DRAFT_367976 [Talaromyces proteolyticus]